MMDPWAFWAASDIAAATGCPEAAVRANWPGIASALDAAGCYDRAIALGVLPTIAIESASTFEPVREAFWLDDAWRREYLRYYPFFGRGYVQLTWEKNYEAAGTALGVDLVGNPDLALDPEIAARVLAWFWSTHGVPSKDGSRYYSLPDLCREGDWGWVRKVVQGGTAGLDRLTAIVAALDAAPTPEEPPLPLPIYLHTTDTVNLRERPTVESTVLAAVPSDTVVEAITEHAWRNVRLPDGTEGWMAADLLAPSDFAPTTIAPADEPKLNLGATSSYDADAQVVTQQHDWDCAQQATLWALTALGRHPDDGWMENDMLARDVESMRVGLTDAAGAKLAGWVRDQYGEYGIGAYNLESASYAQVRDLAGTTPILIGGRHWGHAGHWAGVRRFRNGVLELAQVGGTGPTYGQQTLDRGQFAALGPFSMVVVTGRV